MNASNISPLVPGSTPDRPHLELSGPLLNSAFEVLLAGADKQGGIETWIDALKLKSQMFQQAFPKEDGKDLSLDTLKGLCAFMASVRRRVASWLQQPDFDHMAKAIARLLVNRDDTGTTDLRVQSFCRQFPQDKKHRWVRDLAAELLHGVDPARYPLMNRWVWDSKANTGVIREIWYGDDVDSITRPVPDGYGTYLMLRAGR